MRCSSQFNLHVGSQVCSNFLVGQHQQTKLKYLEMYSTCTRHEDDTKRSGDVTPWPNGCAASLSTKRSRVKIPASLNDENKGLLLMYVSVFGALVLALALSNCCCILLLLQNSYEDRNTGEQVYFLQILKYTFI